MCCLVGNSSEILPGVATGVLTSMIFKVLGADTELSFEFREGPLKR